MTSWLQVPLSSVSTGALYALLLLGLLVVFRVCKAVNFAHGQLGSIAAFGAYTLYSGGVVPVWLAVVLGLAVAAATSWATDRFVLEPIGRRTTREGMDLVVTLGVLLLLTALSEFVFGTTSHTFLSLGGDVPAGFGGIFLTANQVVVTIGVVLLLIGFAVFLARTPFGLAMRATASDAPLASAMGLDVRRVRGATWAVAGLAAGVVGLVVASRLSVDAYYLQPFLIKAVIAGIIGGLDRFVAPLAAAFGLAVFEGFATYTIGTDYGTPAVFVLVIVLLAVLPRRFLAEKGEVRA